MKISLINLDYMTYGDPPLGLAYLASYIRKNEDSLDIKIFDQMKEKVLINKLESYKPDLIGFTAVSQNYYAVKEFATKIKPLFPNSIFLIGGVHITTSQDSFKNSPFDLAVIGEGEVPLLKLIKVIKEYHRLNIPELSKIPGFLLRDYPSKSIINTGLAETLQDLDKIPLPARDLLDMDYYSLPKFSSNEKEIQSVGSILTSRGCPFNCKFCSSSSFWRQNVRFFSSKRVVDEISLLYHKFGFRQISIYDDLFTLNKVRLKEIIKDLKQKGLLGKIKFSVLGRANCFDNEIAKLLKILGVETITFGFETGSQKMLTYLKGKGITIKDSINAIKISKANGLIPGGFFMIGSPNETIRDLELTYQFIKDYCNDNFIVYQTIPFPGTEVWNYAIFNKIINKNIYELKSKNFIDVNLNILLSKEISKKDFIKYFYRIKSLYARNNKTHFLKQLFKIKFNTFKRLLTFSFLKKAFHLRKEFLKRIIP